MLLQLFPIIMQKYINIRVNAMIADCFSDLDT